ncbi:MAG: Mu transposase C-terminal domain-containing protein [Terriglobales bacterium]
MTHSVWISREEVQRVTGWARSTIFLKQKSGELITRPAKSSGNGKAVLEYAASSLPADAQLKLMQLKMSSQSLVPVNKSVSITAIATLPAPDSNQVTMALAAFSAEEQMQAKERLEAIKYMIDFANKTNGHKPLFKGTNGEDFTSLSAVAKHIAKVTQYSERNIWRWWKRYTAPGGVSNLIDGARSDNGKSRFFQEHREAAAFAQNKYLNEKRLSVTLIFEEMMSEWPRLRAHQDAQPPSYTTLRIYLQREIAPLLKIVAREGQRAYNEKAAPFIIRNIEAKSVNEYWISDHMLHDVWVRNDGWFGELDHNEAFRPYLTCIVDMKSRRVVGTAWCVNPSSSTISSALQHAMRKFGKPLCFYVDNGKDFKRLAKDAPTLPVPSDDANKVLFNLGVLVRLGIHPQHCLPLHPQSKQIESFFHTLHQRFDVLWGDAYAGTSPKDRPEECDAILAEHKKLMKLGRGDDSRLPTASEFIQDACFWLDEFNSTHRHGGQGMRMRTPNQVFDAELPLEKRQPVDIRAIAPLFWNYQERTVREGGCIDLFNTRYEPADGESAAGMMLRVTAKVRIACDPLNLGEAIAFDDAGHFLGHLRSQQMLVHGATSEEDIKQSMRARRTYYRAVKQYQSTLERSREAAGDVTTLESLKRRAMQSALPKPNIYALPVPKAVGERAQPRMHVDDIADSFFEEN